jgi:septum formation protein
LKKLILASQSPARKRWLAKIIRARFPKINFVVKPAFLDEKKLLHKTFGSKSLDLKTARKMAEVLARAKAAAIAEFNPDSWVIGADQLLWVNGKILGKPGTEARAHRMLKFCSGKKGYLVTSVALCAAGKTSLKTRVKTQVTILNFANLDSRDISRIVKLDQPLSCAGSFMFEAHGAALFDSVQTDDPTGIEGFPVMRVIRLIYAFGA